MPVGAISTIVKILNLTAIDVISAAHFQLFFQKIKQLIIVSWPILSDFIDLTIEID